MANTKIMPFHGYAKGALLSLSISVLAYWIVTTFISLILGNLLSNLPVFGGNFQDLLVGGFSLLLGYSFFSQGLYKIPVGHYGIPLLLGARQKEYLFQEGFCWYYPAPIGGVWAESVQQKPLNLNVREVLTKDKIPLEVNLNLIYQIVDPHIYLNIDNPLDLLRNNAAEQVCTTASLLTYSELLEQQVVFIQGVLVKLRESMGVSEKRLSERSGTGIFVKSIQLSTIRLPGALENATVRIKVEEQQKISDRTNTETLSEQIELLMKLGLTVQQATAAAQASRGERQVVTIDSETSGAKDGAAFGIGMNSIQKDPKDK